MRIHSYLRARAVAFTFASVASLVALASLATLGAFVTLVSLASLALAACDRAVTVEGAPGSSDGGASSAATPHPSDGGGVACLDYPDGGRRVFPYLASPPAGDFPLCTPSCHPRMAAAGTSIAPLDQDLPSGPCDDEGATCGSGLTAQSCGPCRDVGGPGSVYLCSCRERRWQCAVTSEGASTCQAPLCLGAASDCLAAPTRTGNQLCACGSCRTLCTTSAECPMGTTCHLGEICSASESCAGPDECTGTCTGLCR